MKANGYHHIGLLVSDMEKSLKFYKDGLGGLVTCQFSMKDRDETIYLIDMGNNAVVELIPTGNGEKEENAHWAHIALNVDNARDAYNLALSAGAKIKSEPADMVLGSLDICNAFVFGPDDEVIEFFQVK